MALRDWMIAFNNAKTMESNGEEGPELIAEYERVIEKLGEGPFTEAELHVREEVGTTYMNYIPKWGMRRRQIIIRICPCRDASHASETQKGRMACVLNTNALC